MVPVGGAQATSTNIWARCMNAPHVTTRDIPWIPTTNIHASEGNKRRQGMKRGEERGNLQGTTVRHRKRQRERKMSAKVLKARKKKKLKKCGEGGNFSRKRGRNWIYHFGLTCFLTLHFNVFDCLWLSVFFSFRTFLNWTIYGLCTRDWMTEGSPSLKAAIWNSSFSTC